jgi:hypothetical protein
MLLSLCPTLFTMQLHEPVEADDTILLDVHTREYLSALNSSSAKVGLDTLQSIVWRPTTTCCQQEVSMGLAHSQREVCRNIFLYIRHISHASECSAVSSCFQVAQVCELPLLALLPNCLVQSKVPLIHRPGLLLVHLCQSIISCPLWRC